MKSILAVKLIMEGASNIASSVDSLTEFILWLSVFFFILIIGLMTVFVFLYNHKRQKKATSFVVHNTKLELFWTIVPLILVMWLFWAGAESYIKMVTPPEDCITINVTGKQWAWTFGYENGAAFTIKNEQNREDALEATKRGEVGFTIPVNEPIRLRINSEDVLHSFGIPAFRVKQDAIKGQPRYIWFTATKTGLFRYNCYEMCGTDHSRMSGYVRVVTREEYDKFLVKANDIPIEIFAKNNCGSCHAVKKGAPLGLGPNWWNLAKRKAKFIDGSEESFSKEYFIESIRYPGKKIALDNGKKPLGVMNAFDEKSVSNERIDQLYEYIKTLTDK